MRTRFLGANPAPEIAGVDPRETQISYFIGNDASGWKRGARGYGRVLYRRIYPGIDLVFYGNQRQLEYDFLVSPGADASCIRMEVEGSSSLVVDRDGDLVLGTPTGELRQHKPRVTQEVAGVQREVGGRFVVLGQKEVGFQLDNYDHSRPLAIDPTFSYFTLLGGSGDDRVLSLAADAAGNTYATGETTSLTFPTTPGSYRSTNGGGKDVFVAKLNKTLTSLIYSTFVGGSGNESASGIGVDTFGNAYVTGSTNSTDFPATSNAYQSSNKGLTDGFFFKLAPGGDSLLYSTLIGGAGNDSPAGIFVEPSGRVFISGVTDSDNFPTVAGAYQTTRKGGKDGFVCRFSPNGTLLASSFLGGSADDTPYGLTATASGAVYIGGETFSGNFPVTSDAYQAANGGLNDGFITVLGVGEGSTLGQDPSTVTTPRDGDMRLLYSTFIGGSGADWVGGIALGPDGSIYAAGTTSSNNFQVTQGGFIPSGRDIFLARLPAILGSISTAGAAYPQKVVALQGSGDDTALSAFFLNTYLGITLDTTTPNFQNSGLFPSPNEAYTNFLLFDRNLNPLRLISAAGQDNASGRAGGMFSQYDSMDAVMGGFVTTAPAVPFPNGFQRIYSGGINDGFIGRNQAYQPDSTRILGYAPLSYVNGTTPATTFTPGYAVLDFYPRSMFSTAIARDASGTIFSAPQFNGTYTDSLSPVKQNVYVAGQKMGSGLYDQTRTGWIQWTTPGTLIGMFLSWNGTFTEVDGAPISRTAQRSAIMPFTDTLGYDNLFIYNPNANPVSASLQIVGDNGSVAGSTSLTINSQASVQLSTSHDFFGAGATRLTSTPPGYVQIKGSAGLVSFMNFGRSNQFMATLNGIDADEGSLNLFSPQYAVGQDYISILSVVSLDSFAGNITAQLFKDNGTAWAPAKQVPIGPKGRVVISDPKFFIDPGSSLVQGYVTLSSDGPRLLGSVFFGDPNLQFFGTTLPLVSTLLNRMVFAQLASDSRWFTGIAALNPNPRSANALLSVYDSGGGAPKYTKNLVLAPGERTIGLLTQFFPQLVGVNLSSGFITVVSDQPLAGFALYGTGTRADLAAVPGQRMP